MLHITSFNRLSNPANEIATIQGIIACDQKRMNESHLASVHLPRLQKNHEQYLRQKEFRSIPMSRYFASNFNWPAGHFYMYIAEKSVFLVYQSEDDKIVKMAEIPHGPKHKCKQPMSTGCVFNCRSLLCLYEYEIVCTYLTKPDARSIGLFDDRVNEILSKFDYI